MKHALAVAAAAAGFAAALLAPLHAQPQAPQDDRVRSTPAGRPGPIATDPRIINLPVPRMQDGKPDLTGPWVGGGSDCTLDDPGAFSRPVQLKVTATLAAPGIDLMEYICTENNQMGIAGGYRLTSEGKLEK